MKKMKFFASQELIIYMGKRQMPWPSRYRTKLVLEATGSIASGSASGTYGARMNDIATPLNSSVGGTFPNLLVVNPATANPIGYNKLTAIWDSYRVYGSKISINMTPSALADTIQLCTIPVYSINLPSSLAVAQQNPFAKSYQVSSSRGSGRPMNNFITQHKLAGVSKRAIEDDLSGKFASLAGAGPAEQADWLVFWETPNAANLATTLDYTVKLEYYVEFWQSVSGTFTN